MRWKFENANKVKNIVEGSYDGLLEEYLPLLRQYEEEGLIHLITEKDSEIPTAVWFRHSRENLQTMFDRIPQNVKFGMKDSVLQLSLADMQGDVEKNLSQIVDSTSRCMILSGLYSTNPLKGIPYLY